MRSPSARCDAAVSPCRCERAARVPLGIVGLQRNRPAPVSGAEALEGAEQAQRAAATRWAAGCSPRRTVACLHTPRVATEGFASLVRQPRPVNDRSASNHR